MRGRMTKKCDIEIRFWFHVDKTKESGCWEWTGFKHKEGYGAVLVGGKSKRAHRVSYEMAHGPIPSGMYVCHSCDNPSCVNPAHLWIGTSKDNRVDCVKKGREGHSGGAPKGVIPASRKLTKQQVDKIREFYATGLVSYKELAKMFEVDQSQIFNIIKNKQWRQ